MSTFALESPVIRPRLGRRRQLGDVRVPEQVRGVEGQSRLPCSRHDLDAEDRVDADLEEVVVDADAAPAQQFRRDSGQDLLRGGARRNVIGLRVITVRASGRRKSGSVELAVRRERKRVEENVPRRDHRLGQSILQPAPQVRRRRAGSGRGHDVRREPLLSDGILEARRLFRSLPGGAPARPRPRRARRGTPAPSPGRLAGPAAPARPLTPARTVSRRVHP